ncbi:MAG: NAD(P) transhydrogenase subunit alpha [Clostridiales bacterium]|nr:NAD(P) transhydrogenase subunit alpha [Clostridiales bacterium]
MIIGVPKEIMPGERRVSAIPETVAKMTGSGAQVLVQKGAGEGAFYQDEEYVKAGAEIVADAAEVFKRAEVILKVKEPQFNKELNLHEIDMMRGGQYLITFIHPAAPANHQMVKDMAAKGITGLTLDGVPRITRAQNMDALTSMSTCAGYKGILLAANHLAKFIPMIGSAVGAIKPINAFIIGVGVGGLQALATVKRLGAVTYAADIRPDAAEQAMSLGAKVVDLGVPADQSVGQGGYARMLTPEWLEKEREAIKETVAKSDILFLSALVPNMEAPILVTEDMVKSMKPGSVIIDISIDQGGNCAVTPPGTTEVVHGVTICGVKNIPGMLPTSSTWMFAQNIYNLLNYLTKDGKIVLDRNDDIVKGILTTVGGDIVHEGAKVAINSR